MSALTDYLSHCRRVNTNPHTTERSYYSALEALLNAHAGPDANAHSCQGSAPAMEGQFLKLPERVPDLLHLESRQRRAAMEGQL